MVRGELGGRLPEALVQASQRGAAIAGDEPCRIQTGALVVHTLVHRQPNQSMYAAQPGPPGPQVVSILKARCVQGLPLFRRKGGIHASGLLVGSVQPGSSPAAALMKRLASPAKTDADGLTAGRHEVSFNRKA